MISDSVVHASRITDFKLLDRLNKLKMMKANKPAITRGAGGTTKDSVLNGNM